MNPLRSYSPNRKKAQDMKSPPLRVIFDRSAFHGSRYQALKDSRLRDLCRRGRIEVFHTFVFINETIASVSAGERAADWPEHLQFALEICNGGIFLTKEQIWHEEIVAGRGKFARNLLPEHPNKNYFSRPQLVDRLQEVASTGDPSPEWSDTEGMRMDNRQKRRNQRTIMLDARNEVARIRRERGITDPFDSYTFAELCNDSLLHTGRDLMDLVCARRAASLTDQWARCPQRFPFYSAFIEGILYAFHHAVTRQNDPVDENAQLDYEQLCYLTWADIVVSDDQKFFRQTFEDIWKPRGKRFETAESFAALANRIA